MKHRTAIIVLGLIVIVFAVLLTVLAFHTKTKSPTSITNYQQCAEAGYPIQATYPSVCRVPNGPSFTNPSQPAPTSP